MCVASVCEPVPEPKVRVEVDSDVRRQELIGFGATLAYGEADVIGHPRQAALYDAAFRALGLDVLRFRNRYGNATDGDLTTTAALIDAAAQSIGREPTVLLTSWSPPPALKANGALNCAGNPGTCTLAKDTATGAYVYDAFGAFWRESLEAYAAAGIVPSFIGIQNNANWVPSAQEPGEACKFLPVEGSTNVRINGADVEIAYPGYREALQATLDALEGLAVVPKVLAPETADFATVSDYTPDLDFGQVDALAHHLYGVNAGAIDTAALAALGNFGTEFARPILQTEMQADGFDTSVLIHHTLEIEGGSAYLQSTLAGPSMNRLSLIQLGPNDFVLEEPYYAMQHYARYTDPGWVRVQSTSSLPSVLATTWVSPDEAQQTLVLVNTGVAPLAVELVLDRAWGSSEVRRTVFVYGSMEQFADLGALSAEGILRMPGSSIATVWLRN
jgi:O-glycosyl hydrolase